MLFTEGHEVFSCLENYWWHGEEVSTIKPLPNLFVSSVFFPKDTPTDIENIQVMIFLPKFDRNSGAVSILAIHDFLLLFTISFHMIKKRLFTFVLKYLVGTYAS